VRSGRVSESRLAEGITPAGGRGGWGCISAYRNDEAEDDNVYTHFPHAGSFHSLSELGTTTCESGGDSGDGGDDGHLLDADIGCRGLLIDPFQVSIVILQDLVLLLPCEHEGCMMMWLLHAGQGQGGGITLFTESLG
jgi:hypothetical protein